MGYLAGKYDGIVTEIKGILAANGPTRADADWAESLYDVLDATNRAKIDKAALDAATAGGAAGFIPQPVKDTYDAALAAMGKAQDVADKITALPGHKPGDECTANGSDYGTHKPSVGQAKLACEKLTQDERELISGAQRNKLNAQYDALITYLEYISKKDNVEVVGLAENVKTSDIVSAPGDKITIELSVEKRRPLPARPRRTPRWRRQPAPSKP